jgi:hypothetical protein
MRVFIIDTSNVGPELQCGLIGVVGSAHPSEEEKRECVDIVSRYAIGGWAISSDPFTPIGWLAAITAETARVPFVSEGLLRLPYGFKAETADGDVAEPSRSGQC